MHFLFYVLYSILLRLEHAFKTVLWFLVKQLLIVKWGTEANFPCLMYSSAKPKSGRHLDRDIKIQVFTIQKSGPQPNYR